MGLQGGGGRPGFTIGGERDGGANPNAHGVDAWVPEPMPPAPKTIEYRMQVRGGALTISLLDPDARMPLSATALLAHQAQKPTADRDALRSSRVTRPRVRAASASTCAARTPPICFRCSRAGGSSSSRR
jgi:hypothetical protein